MTETLVAVWTPPPFNTSPRRCFPVLRWESNARFDESTFGCEFNHSTAPADQADVPREIHRPQRRAPGTVVDLRHQVLLRRSVRPDEPDVRLVAFVGLRLQRSKGRRDDLVRLGAGDDLFYAADRLADGCAGSAPDVLFGRVDLHLCPGISGFQQCGMGGTGIWFVPAGHRGSAGQSRAG